jgi:hypothetical protein
MMKRAALFAASLVPRRAADAERDAQCRPRARAPLHPDNPEIAAGFLRAVVAVQEQRND